MDPVIPKPDVMPIDREKWRGELNLSNFINAYYQFRDVQSLGACRTMLIVGPGQGLDAAVFRWRGLEVTTFDIDETFNPDVVGSVHDMHKFEDGKFDVVIASHVLEHLALPFLAPALAELARVGRFAIIYLPFAGRHGQIRFRLGARNAGFDYVWDVFNRMETPSGIEAIYCEKQHFWEVGYRGFRVSDLISRFLPYFHVRAHYRNHDWLPSYNFVLESRRDRSP